MRSTECSSQGVWVGRSSPSRASERISPMATLTDFSVSVLHCEFISREEKVTIFSKSVDGGR